MHVFSSYGRGRPCFFGAMNRENVSTHPLSAPHPTSSLHQTHHVFFTIMVLDEENAENPEIYMGPSLNGTNNGH